MADHPAPIRSGQSRSTGNRRAVRNALFRSMMDRRKLRESDLYRVKFVDAGPARITTFGPPHDYDTVDEPRASCGLGPVGPSPHGIIVRPPEPHPWVRLWRRLIWGE